MQTNNLSFITTGIDLSKLGFKLQDKKMYESLISPFAQDQQIPHPFKISIPESFKAFQFSLEKLDKKNLADETFLYIFYNIMDEKIQLVAAEMLMTERKHRLHKELNAWMKQTDQGVFYFHITSWKYLPYEQPTQDKDFYTFAEILEDSKNEGYSSSEEEEIELEVEAQEEGQAQVEEQVQQEPKQVQKQVEKQVQKQVQEQGKKSTQKQKHKR